MKSHTIVGAQTLESVLVNYPANAFLNMGVEIARSHHEHWDGSGYPDGLAGDLIPLAARIVTVGDQYDALRSTRPYKAPFPHDRVVRILTEGDGRTLPEHFDPRVLDAFRAAEGDFARIWDEFATEGGPTEPPAHQGHREGPFPG